ncbi:arginine--tRNA ligase [Bacteriovoracaceae bacterium]|nr:arginine--tRNA ligase [Bacteriovoracaceae bacterium]
MDIKNTQYNLVYNQIAKSLEEAINALGNEIDLSIEDISKSLSIAPNMKMGHIAFGCFQLAKQLKKAPPQIASEICEKLVVPNTVSEAKVVGPYLNFFISPKGLGEDYLSTVLDESLFKQKLFADDSRVMIEYSQPNTHKVLHVGHMRNLCLGNALVRLCRYSGLDTLAVTYPGDMGTHVAKCLWYLKYKETSEAPKENKGAWLGEIYAKSNALLEDEKGTDKEDKNREQLTAILKELHSEQGPFYDLWKETREWSIELMKESYQWADVEFDRWFFESEVDAKSLEYVNELYKQGVLVKDQGAIGMNLEEDKLGFCLLVKSDGTGLYSTKDVELAKVKFEEFNVDHNVYVVDNRQAFHFKQVFKVLEKVGFEKSKNCFHLEYAMVDLPDGAMSSRKGNIIPLLDLVSQMEETIKTNYLQKYLDDGSWTKEEVEKTATQIANGAIKYGMTKIDNNRKIVFDMNEWLKLDGDTGPYLQYVYARINSLSNKLSSQATSAVDWSLLTKDQEVALMVKLITFNDIAASCAKQLKTINLCSYLFELGKLFNSFYAECPIGKAETPELLSTRLALAKSCGLIMKKGLSLIGIEAPEKM